MLFAYFKRGFPMKGKLLVGGRENEIDESVKQIDLASIASHILGLPLPF